MTYQQKLQDPRWRVLSRELKRHVGNVCQDCGCSPEVCGPLQTHHVAYLKGKEPWEHPATLLRVLCDSCHYNHQVEDDEAKEIFAQFLAKKTWHEVRAIKKALISATAANAAWREVCHITSDAK